MSLKDDLKYLRLPYIRNNYDDLLKEAQDNKYSYDEFLRHVIELEAESHHRRGIQQRIREAHFPTDIVLGEYHRDHLSVDNQNKIEHLSSLEFIDKGENVILVGAPGVGKTALATALGMAACLAQKSVLFLNAADLLIELSEAMSNEAIFRYKKRFQSFDLIIVDELDYLSFSGSQAEIFFNLLSSRTQKKSIIITSNMPVEKWNNIFGSQQLTLAIIDRLIYKSWTLDLGTKSYRVMETLDWQQEINQQMENKRQRKNT